MGAGLDQNFHDLEWDWHNTMRSQFFSWNFWNANNNFKKGLKQRVKPVGLPSGGCFLITSSGECSHPPKTRSSSRNPQPQLYPQP